MDLKQYLTSQIKEIEEYKWKQGEILNKDPGEAAVKEWVEKNAKSFREQFYWVYDKLKQTVIDNIASETLETACSETKKETIDELIEYIIDEFVKEWITEKVFNPDNKFLDSI